MKIHIIHSPELSTLSYRVESVTPGGRRAPIGVRSQSVAARQLARQTCRNLALDPETAIVEHGMPTLRRKGAGEASCKVQSKVTGAHLATLERRAARDGVTVSEVVRGIIAEACSKDI